MVTPPWVVVCAWVDSKIDVNTTILDVYIRTKLQICEFVWKNGVGVVGSRQGRGIEFWRVGLVGWVGCIPDKGEASIHLVGGVVEVGTKQGGLNPELCFY